MGVFSKVHRFHEKGENPNVNNVDRFGIPVYSLYTSTKLLSLHHNIDITDNNDNIVYRASSKVISLHDKTEVFDSHGEIVARIEKKLFSFHERHFITMSNGESFELSNEMFHLIKDITNIEGLGWQLRGNILGLNFELYDANDNIIAVIGQKMMSLHDKYCVDIYRKEHEKKVIAILITLQHMIRDRQAAGANASGGGSSSGS